MSSFAKSAVRRLIKSLGSGAKDQSSMDLLSENFVEAVKEPTFYNLPFDVLIEILTKWKENESYPIDDTNIYITTISTFIQTISEKYKDNPTQVLSLLMYIDVDNFTFEYNDYFKIIGSITVCPFLTKLSEFNQLPEKDIEAPLKQEIQDLKSQLESEMQSDIFKAIAQDRLANVKYLIENKKVDVNTRDKHGFTPLIKACQTGNMNICKYLLNVEGIDVNAVNELGSNAFHFACVSDNLDLVKMLFNQYHFDVNGANKSKNAPIHIASCYGKDKNIGFLLDHGANINAKGEKGRTPIFYATMNGHASSVRFLLSKGADKNIPDDNNVIPIQTTTSSEIRDLLRS